MSRCGQLKFSECSLHGSMNLSSGVPRPDAGVSDLIFQQLVSDADDSRCRRA